MKVFVVSRGSCSTCLEVVGVYSTFEKACEATLGFGDAGVETWELDTSEAERVDFPVAEDDDRF